MAKQPEIPITEGTKSAKRVIHRTLLEAIIEDIVAYSAPNKTGLVVVSRYKISKLVKSLTRDYGAQYQPVPLAFLFRDNAKVLVVTSDELQKGLDAIQGRVDWALVDESVADDSAVRTKL